MLLEVLVAYLCGSIPFGLILSNLFGKGNLRTSGSGNIGATNVVRTQGKLLGGLTFLLDGLKGAIPFFIFDSSHPVLMFVAAVIGHMFPVWLRFSGGKGISTFFGAMLAFEPITSVISMLIWLGTFLVTKISSISGLIAISAGSAIFLFNHISTYAIWESLVFLIVPVCIFIKHKGNIERLINGNEKSVLKDKN